MLIGDPMRSLLRVFAAGSFRLKNGTLLTSTSFDPEVLPIFELEGFIELLKKLEFELFRMLEPPILLINLDPPSISSEDYLEADII